MGSACCVAARDRAVLDESSCENLQRNVRQSPTWSFRWDNRGRVAGEETPVNWSSDGIGGNDGLEFKSGTTVGTVYASEEGSPLDSFRSLAWQKSPVSERNNRNFSLPLLDPLAERNSTEVKEFACSSALSFPSPVKLSPSAPSVSSLSASPLSSRGQLPPASFTPCLPRHSSAHQLGQQVSDSRVPGMKSPTFSISEESSSFVLLPGWSNDSTRGSHGGSSDGWSVPAFADLANPRRDRWSFDSESFGFHRERATSRGSGSSSFDLQTCGICAKLLNELAVAVLVCGHVFHAECLENMTSEINRYDPACPVCTFGEKQALKIYEKAKAKIELNARKRFRNRIVDSDISGNLARFERQKSSAHEGGCPRMSSSSSMKSPSKRPFLRHYFSFGSKGSRSYSESPSTRRRGFSWTRSNKK
ncbi:uncharacterized protein [Solanum tuberosum]|uniref:Zinc ion binding protein n=1 Tax=Solanum tuberosum TaxID=4113 RepID=M1CEZ9_SOLTU|nr:PREDICTED: uncharacterized protein LOC102579695 [Solanum tuberosum]XP_015170411.1 PREDICTED: uncharacterized protein LOC102579695 [Solanum tuberosum]